jgi:hypothetical protein
MTPCLGVLTCRSSATSYAASQADRCCDQAWLRDPQRGNERLLFPNAKGGRLSVHGVQHLLRKHANVAKSCPLSKGKRVTVHLLRHTMSLVAGAVARRRRPCSHRLVVRSRIRRQRRSIQTNTRDEGTGPRQNFIAAQYAKSLSPWRSIAELPSVQRGPRLATAARRNAWVRHTINSSSTNPRLGICDRLSRRCAASSSSRRTRAVGFPIKHNGEGGATSSSSHRALSD